jgi:hypothetical protein
MALTEQEREAIKQAQRAYKAEWRKKNKDKIRATNERYWLKKAATLANTEKDDSEQGG